jgi:hypothetical protein
MKWKPCLELDAPVIGVLTGRSGEIESVMVRVGGQLVHLDVGIRARARERMARMHAAGALIGAVIEVGYTRITARGRLLHPRFRRVKARQ